VHRNGQAFFLSFSFSPLMPFILPFPLEESEILLSPPPLFFLELAHFPVYFIGWLGVWVRPGGKQLCTYRSKQDYISRRRERNKDQKMILDLKRKKGPEVGV